MLVGLVLFSFRTPLFLYLGGALLAIVRILSELVWCHVTFTNFWIKVRAENFSFIYFFFIFYFL